MKRIPNDAKILFACIGVAGFFGVAALISMHFGARTVQSPQADNTHFKAKRTLALDPAVLEAKSAIIMDAETGEILFSKAAEEQRPLASLTKLATALAVLSHDENRFITIRASDLEQDGDTHLHAGDVWRLGDLVAFGLTTSSNDAMTAAAQVLTEKGTVSNMNAAAVAEGLAQSYFLNPTGLDISSSTAGAYGSARDVATLVATLLKEHPAIFKATARPPKPNLNSGKGAVSTLEPLWSIPGLIAAKTGYTDLAGGNLAAAVDLGLGEPVIAVVLGSGHESRFIDVQKLIDAARAARTTVN